MESLKYKFMCHQCNDSYYVVTEVDAVQPMYCPLCSSEEINEDVNIEDIEE